MQVFTAMASAAEGDGGNPLSGLIFPLLILLLIVYFFAVQRRRAKAHQQQLAQIVPGTMVMTTAGLYATVVEMDGADVLLEVAPDVVCRFSRNAIARVVSAPEPAAAGSGSAGGTDGEPASASGDSGADEAEDKGEQPRKEL